MSNWAETELAACQLHDARHAKRLAQVLTRLSEKPVPSIPLLNAIAPYLMVAWRIHNITMAGRLS